MLANRLAFALTLAAFVVAGWSWSSRDVIAQAPAPAQVDPAAIVDAPSLTPPPTQTDPAAVPHEPALMPPPTAVDPPLTPVSPPAVDTPAGGLDPAGIAQGTAPPDAQALQPLLPPTDPAAAPDSFPPSGPQFGSFQDSPQPVDPFDPTSASPTGSLDPFGVPPALGAEIRYGGPPAEATPELSAKFLLLETDWEKANDRDRAMELATALTSGPFDLTQADTTILRRGYAALFQQNGAQTFVTRLNSLGLVRQTFSSNPFELNLDGETRALGVVTTTFSAPGPDGNPESQEWNLLVVSQPYQAHFANRDQWANPGTVRIAVVGWKIDSQASGEELPTNPSDPPRASERYVGSFVLAGDRSALVPLNLPGVEGLTIAIVPSGEAHPAVRSLGPVDSTVAQTPLSATPEFDWEALIRAYESVGASRRPAKIVGERPQIEATSSAAEAKDGYTVALRPLSEDDVKRVVEVLGASSLGIEVLSTNSQGDGRASVEIQAKRDASQAIYDLVKKAFPNATVQIGVHRSTPSETVSPASGGEEQPAEEPSQEAVILNLRNASAADAAKIVEALKPDRAIRIVVDERTNSLILSAPPKTKFAHVQSLIELLRTLDEQTDVEPPKAEATSSRRLGVADAAKLRNELVRVEGQIKTAAADARDSSGTARDEKIRSLRELVTQAFRLRLDLQREEAAELRDRLNKIEGNLERRERVEGAVVDRRIEVLLDPALEWPDLSLDEASQGSGSPTTTSTLEPPATNRLAPASTPMGSSLGGTAAANGPSYDASRRGDSFSAATTLAIEIAELNGKLESLNRVADWPPDKEVRLALIQRQLDLLRAEFVARHQALQQELQASQAKVRAAQTSWQRISELRDTGSVSSEEAQKAELNLETAKADLARQEILLQQYQQARERIETEPSAPADSENGSTGTTGFVPLTSEEVPAVPPRSLVPSELQGRWLLTKYAVLDNPNSRVPRTSWTFAGDELTVERSGREDIVYATEFVSGSSPGEFRTFRFQKVPQDREIVERAFAYRFQLDGDRLRVVQGSSDGRSLPQAVAPARGVVYFEFERAVDDAQAAPDATEAVSATTPDALKGSWKLVRRANGDESLRVPPNMIWTFDERTLRSFRGPAGIDPDISEIVFSDSAPNEFLWRFLRPTFDASTTNAETRVRFELRDAQLHLLFQNDEEAAFPDRVEPTPGFSYYAFERSADPRTSIQLLPSGDESVVPPELQGTWRLTKRSASDGADGQVPQTLWTFDRDTLLETQDGKPIFRYLLDFSHGDPGGIQADRIVEASWGPVPLGPGFEATYEVAEEGESLRVSRTLHSSHPVTLPSKVAPGNGVETLEFRRESSEEATASAAEGKPVPQDLLGAWKMTKQILPDGSEREADSLIWIFDGANLGVTSGGEAQTYPIQFVDSPEGTPDRFERYRLRETSEERDQREVISVFSYELTGDRLRAVEAPGRSSLPSSVAPSKNAAYYELERVSAEVDPGALAQEATTPEFAFRPLPAGSKIEPTVPPELIGTWRLSRHVAESAPNAAPAFSTWNFDETTLASEPTNARYEVTSSPDSPGTFSTYRFETLPEGLAHEGTTFRFRYEVEGDRLKVALGRGEGAPEKAAPDTGVVYYEFDRLAKELANMDDASEPASAPADEAALPELQRRAKAIAARIREQDAEMEADRRRLQSQGGLNDRDPRWRYLQEELANAKAALRDHLFYAERASEAAEKREKEASDEAAKSEAKERFDRLSRSVVAIRELAEELSLPLDDGRKPEAPIERDVPKLEYPAEELRREYEATKKKYDALAANEPERATAAARIDWLRRTALWQANDLRRFVKAGERYVTREQDEFFVHEKALADLVARGEPADSIDAGAVRLAASDYEVERTREVLEETKAELDALDLLNRTIDPSGPATDSSATAAPYPTEDASPQSGVPEEGSDATAPPAEAPPAR